MNVILSGLRWALKASIFIGLLAFALNNTQEVSVHLFFGQTWQTPLVLLVLVSFIMGLLLGVLGVLFSMHFSKHRRAKSTPVSAAPLSTHSVANPDGPSSKPNGTP